MGSIAKVGKGSVLVFRLNLKEFNKLVSKFLKTKRW